MKRLFVLAAGTFAAAGAALAVSGVITTAPASAQPNPPPTCGETPIGLTPENIVCNIASQGSSFAMSVSPAYNAQVLLFGTQNADGTPSGLGLVDQPTTFLNSLQTFFSGPTSPGGPPTAAAPHAPGDLSPQP
jgi:hypothetical protein